MFLLSVQITIPVWSSKRFVSFSTVYADIPLAPQTLQAFGQCSSNLRHLLSLPSPPKDSQQKQATPNTGLKTYINPVGIEALGSQEPLSSAPNHKATPGITKPQALQFPQAPATGKLPMSQRSYEGFYCKVRIETAFYHILARLSTYFLLAPCSVVC